MEISKEKLCLNKRDEFIVSQILPAIKSLKFGSVEIGIEKNTDKASDIDPAFILGGLIYSIKDNFDIDFGAKFGLNSAETDNTIVVGMVLKY